MTRFIVIVVLFLVPSFASAGLYWCPDGEVRGEPTPGCQPLVKPPEPPKEGEEPRPALKPIPVHELFPRIDTFRHRYDSFLRCCSTDPFSLEDLDALQEELARILLTLENNLQRSALVFAGGRQYIAELAQASQRLNDLKARLEELGDVMNRIPQQGYVEGALEQRRLDDMQEATQKEFAPAARSERAATGTEIGTTPPALADTTLPARSGEAIGAATRSGAEIGTAGRTGGQIGTNPQTGLGISTTPRTGVEIGESDLNRP